MEAILPEPSFNNRKRFSRNFLGVSPCLGLPRSRICPNKVFLLCCFLCLLLVLKKIFSSLVLLGDQGGIDQMRCWCPWACLPLHKLLGFLCTCQAACHLTQNWTSTTSPLSSPFQLCFPQPARSNSPGCWWVPCECPSQRWWIPAQVLCRQQRVLEFFSFQPTSKDARSL